MYLSECCHVPPETHLSEEGTGCFICPSCDKGCNIYDTSPSTSKKKLSNAKNYEPKAHKLSTKYKITHKQKEFTVEVSTDDKLTIAPHYNIGDDYHNEGFVFKNSKREMVKTIGEMLILSSKL